MAPPALLFPNAPALVGGHLETALQARGQRAPVSPRIPNPRPSRFLVVARLGGVRQTVTDAAQLTVECWEATPDRADDLAQLVRALLAAMADTVIGGVNVYRVDELSGPQDLPHPSGQPRRVLNVVVHLRGVALTPS